MLDLVRSKQKSFLVKITFGLIILSFVIGYTMLTAPNDSGVNQRGDVAATVNGDEISYSSFQAGYNSLYNLYQSIYQGKFNAEVEKRLNLPKQALQQLIHEQLLVQEADRLNLDVSKQELVRAIAQYDAFQENGVFNRDRYLQVLNYQRMPPEQFEAAQYRQMLSQKVREQLQQNVVVSDTELQEAFHKENDKVNLNYTWLTPTLVETKVIVSNEGLATFFALDKEPFRFPEKVSLRYLQFDPARYEKDIANFTDNELQRYYRRHLDLFEIIEQIKAAHILLKIDQGADEKTVQKRRELAAELLKQLKEGGNFAQLAKAHSDDRGTADNGGDLGYFSRGMMVSSFEDTAFKLKPGQLSGIVQTPFGFHIIKVTEKIDAGVKPLVDAIEEVKAGLLVEKARQLAYEKAMDAYNINRKTGDLDSAAKNNDLGIKETGFFGHTDAIDGIGKVPAISRAAFSLKDGELARPVQTTQGIFLFTLKERQASRLPELEEVKALVELAYRTEQAQTLAKELADKLLAKAQELKSLRKAAAELKLTIEESGEFSRSFGAFIPRIGSSAELAETAFNLTVEEPIAPLVYTIDNKYLVASLKKAKQADFAGLDTAERAQFQEQLLLTKKEEAINSKLDGLLKQAQIEVMIPELIKAFAIRSEQQ
ncbi:MAG: SurA N-terminal domain-containing protein [Desulfuromonadales bacterium]|nr:SurA N-terminal domain-containing protein [Desulfuromonadales bacterium]